jgi:hypothetical protein
MPPSILRCPNTQRRHAWTQPVPIGAVQKSGRLLPPARDERDADSLGAGSRRVEAVLGGHAPQVRLSSEEEAARAALIYRAREAAQVIKAEFGEQLVISMTEEVENRPAVMSKASAFGRVPALSTPGAQRHTTDLVPDRASGLVEGFPGAWVKLRAELSVFADFLGAAS